MKAESKPVIKIIREGGLFGYRIYQGRKKIGAKITQFTTEVEAIKDANESASYLAKKA